MEPISGMEISQFQDREALLELSSFCTAEHLAFGVHGPILGGKGYTLPRLTSPDEAERAEALQRVEQEVRLAAEIGAEYILYHYPFLPLFGPMDRIHYSNLPVAGQRYDTNRLSERAFRELSHRLFDGLCQLQHHYGQRIVLEHDFFGGYEGSGIDMFHKYPEIELVVDTARLDIASRISAGFDPYGWLDAAASSVYLVHYSNVQYAEDRFYNHQPVLSSQDEDPGYGDAAAYLAYLAARNSRFHVTFEHQAASLSPQELRELYARTAGLLGMRAT
ncbi:TIM barrel protein [Paenibacillus sp. KR2-11]|uniref:TIM barrel protein n=1 Tax=Paenibacillus sp. KR2-11 TaxID=3385500 RepID=UPI0038FBF888